MSKIDEVIEQLRCALYNCENIRTGGTIFIDITKMQIQEAIDILDGKDTTIT